MKNLKIKIALIIAGLILLSTLAPAQISINANWKDGDLLQNKTFYKYSVCTPWGATLSPKWSGVRFELNNTDTICGGSKRTELYFYTGTEHQKFVISDSIPAYFPNDYAPIILLQLHQNGKYTGLYPSTKYPSLTLQISNGRWLLTQSFNPENVKIGNPIQKNTDLGLVEKQKTTVWAIDIKFSFDSSGVLKIYKNGSLYTKITGANWNKEDGILQTSTLCKFGIYGWKYNGGTYVVPQRIIYVSRFQLYRH